MCTAFDGVDVVGVAVKRFVVTFVVLERDLGGDPVFFFFDVNDFRMKRLFGAVDVLDELFDATIEFEQFFLGGAFVCECDLNAAIQERQLAQPVGENVVIVFNDRENFAVSLEGNFGAGTFGFTNDFEFRRGFTTLKPHVMDFAIALNFDLKTLAERVDAGYADAVQTTGNGIAFLIKLTAGMEHGEHNFNSRLLLRLVHVHRNAAPIVNDGDGVSNVDNDFNIFTKSG